MVDLKHVSCCLITKEPRYPEVLAYHISQFPFGEIVIHTNCESVHRRYELFQRARFDLLYCQDDDAICPIAELAEQADPDVITCAMKTGHLAKYASSRIALIGWGAILAKPKLAVLDQYRARYGEDSLFRRETDRILTYLNYPQRRLDLPIADLPSHASSDRMSMQPHHYDYLRQVEARCATLANAA